MKIFLTDRQLDKLSDILINTGTVLFASTIVPAVFGFAQIDIMSLASGLALTTFCWFVSLYLLRKRK